MNFLKKLLFKCLLRIRSEGIFYINGPETLPAPLTPEQEQEVIRALPANWAKDMLIEHNLRLVAFIAKRFEATGIGIEDLISIGTPGLMKAINTFCPDKSIKLATYASRCIENEILMYLRKNSNQKCEVSLDEPLSSDWDGNELLLSDVLSSDEEGLDEQMERKEEEKAVRSAVALLEPRERELIELRYGIGGKEEKTQKEVADMLGISQSYISRLEKRILARLKEVLS